MSSKAYLIPEDNLTFSDQQKYRVGALAAGVQRAYNRGIASWDQIKLPLSPDANFKNTPDIGELKQYIASGGWPDNLDAREFQPILDAGAGAGLDFWYTSPLLVVGNEYPCIGVVNPALGANRINKIVSWYRVQVVTTPMPVNRILFRRNLLTGLLQYEFDLQQIASEERTVGYFSEPVVWDNNTNYSLSVLCRIATLVVAEVVVDNFVIEPAGTTNV